ncbi:TPA: hypothetical protein DEG21_02615 [Patescibacteria group bacterium]|nr:hypothetical protein [Candidatus Gracilibacteria bacterium]HBY74768.1 hypothetical protein [Candidatus Gracilibacteria bacterium]
MDREDIQKDELKERLINISYDIVIIIHDYHIPLFQDKSYNILSEIIQIIKNFNIKVIVG